MRPRWRPQGEVAGAGREVRGPGAREELDRGPRRRVPRKPAACRVDDLLRDRPVCRDLSAYDGENALHAFARRVVEERVLAGDLPFAHALLAHESADTCPREVDLVERRRGKGATRFVLEVAHVLLTRRDVARIPRVVSVRRADDRRAAP